MKHIAIILFLISIEVHCQTKFKLDTKLFLLGMLDDYNGRSIAPENEESASYIGTVRPELQTIFLDSISKTYGVSKETIQIKEFSLFNKKIADLINENFLAKLHPAVDLYDEKNNKSFKIYSLSLDIEKLNTTEKKLSFLVGMFFHCGRIIDDEVVFKTANSNNFYVSIKLLTSLGLTFTEETSPEYNMPTVQKITFKPNAEFLVYLKKIKIKN